MAYIFSEQQKFKQKWLWLIIIGTTGFSFFLIVRLLVNYPFNVGLWIALASILLIVVLFYSFKLETKISKEGIEVRFFPFHRSFIKIPWANLSKAEVREYSPLGEYGGWGFRYGSSGKAYNVSGNVGIQLTYIDGTLLLIGTNKKEEAEEALKFFLINHCIPVSGYILSDLDKRE